MTRLGLIGAWLCVSAGVATAGDTIPEPDLILYGNICVAGGPSTDTDDISVIARTTIAKESVVVGSYRMGDQPAASDCLGDADCYVLRVRVETTPTDVAPSGTAVVLTPANPATVELFIKEGSSPETLVATASVNDRGVIRQMELNPQAITADLNGDAQTDSLDFVILHGGLAGPEVSNAQACDPRDINRDGHIDLKDIAVLQAAFEGPGG